MKKLEDVIIKKHKGNYSRFIRHYRLDERKPPLSCAQVSRWVSYGCYIGKIDGKLQIVRPLDEIEEQS